MSHTPLQMVGPLGNGRMGIYNSEQIRDWIIGKLGLGANQAKIYMASISQIVNDFMSGKGKATSGPNKHIPHGNFKTPVANHTSMYLGNPIYHASSGTPGKPGSCTIFYVNAAGNTGKIIGIGQHLNSTTYAIDWHVNNWHVGKRITLA